MTPQFLPAFAFRCPDDPSVVRWVNTDSDEVPAADVVPCPAS
ncbi:hypothetical protein [Streptomyces sp. NPDC049944]